MSKTVSNASVISLSDPTSPAPLSIASLSRLALPFPLKNGGTITGLVNLQLSAPDSETFAFMIVTGGLIIIFPVELTFMRFNEGGYQLSSVSFS